VCVVYITNLSFTQMSHKEWKENDIVILTGGLPENKGKFARLLTKRITHVIPTPYYIVEVGFKHLSWNKWEYQGEWLDDYHRTNAYFVYAEDVDNCTYIHPKFCKVQADREQRFGSATFTYPVQYDDVPLQKRMHTNKTTLNPYLIKPI